MHKKIFLILALLVSATLLWGCSGSGVVATVNGKDITTQQLDEELAAMKSNLEQQGYVFEGDEGKEMEDMLRSGVLEQMIDQELIMQEIERLNLMPSDSEVETELELIKEQLGSEGEYKKFLAANDINEPKLKDLVKQQQAGTKLQEQIMSEVPEPTDDEIQSYYDNNKEQFSQPEQRQVSHILIGTGDYSEGQNRSEADAKVLALQVVDKLNTGADFGELAKEYSDDPGSKDNGGQYPPFSRGSGFAKEFEDAAFELSNGEYTQEPVRTQFGYHIILLDETIPANQISISDVQEDISAMLMENAAMEKMNDYMADLRDKAEIENKLDQGKETEKKAADGDTEEK